MVPAQTTTIRVRGPGGWGDYRLGWGLLDSADASTGRCVSGANCDFDYALGTAAESGQDNESPANAWTAPSGGWVAASASGISVAAGRHLEWRFTSLSSNAEFNWQVECQEDGFWGPARLGIGQTRTLPAAGAASEVRVLGSADLHLMTSYYGLATTLASDDTGSESDTGLCLATDNDPTDGIAGIAYVPFTACDEDSDCTGLGSATCSCPTANTIAENVEDCDVNGLPDYRAQYDRALSTILEMESYASTFKPHVIVDLGDLSELHANSVGNPCGSGKVGPCAIPSGSLADYSSELLEDGDDLEVPTQLLRWLAHGQTEELAGGVGQEEGFDDGLLVALNRRAFAQNRYAKLSRLAPVVFKDGNHEDHGLLGTPISVYGHYSAPYASGDAGCNASDAASAIDPTCSGLGLRDAAFSNTERENNPNDLYPNGISHATHAVLEESGETFSFAAGKACLVFLDEYIHTNGKDEDDKLFATGTSFPDSECGAGLGNPLKPCFSTLVDKNGGAPSTPYEWRLGPQLSWLTGTAIPACDAAGARSLLRFSHHGFGTSKGAQADRYDYGRVFCPQAKRRCRESSGGTIIVNNDTTYPENGGITSRLTGLTTNAEVPCWGASGTGAAEAYDPWCDWVVDGNETDDTGFVCEAASFAGVDPDVGESELRSAINTAISASDIDVALHNGAHDHIAYLCDFLDAKQAHLTWPFGGWTTAASWENNVAFRDFFDADQSGAPDYRTSPVLAARALLGLAASSLSPVDSSTFPARGWNGKGFTAITVASDGTITAEVIEAPTADYCYGTNDPWCPARTSRRGTVVIRKVLNP